jgi:octaprenyl-diphosphate synthase
MTLDEIKAFLGKDWTDTLEMIRCSLATDQELLDATNKAIISNGGKRLRPLLALLSARSCSGGRVTLDTIRFAASAELLHNATLLHDDVADSSSQRRGRPTVNSILGGPASVLIGDFWLTKALDNILSSRKHGGEVIRIFSKTLSDLAEGEILQLQKAASCDTTEADCLRIIYGKTASLFEAAVWSAAISVDAPEDLVSALRDYAVSLGTAFQIKDDLFDYSDGRTIGKPVGIDLAERKITIPLIGALAGTDPETASRIRRQVMEIDEHPEHKESIRDFVLRSGGIDYARQRLEEYVGKAEAALEVLPDSAEKDYLAQIARFTADRTE